MNRRTACRALGALSATGLAGCLERPRLARPDGGVKTSDPGNWPTFGADAAHTGYRPDGVGPASGTIRWSAIGDAPTVLCPPTVADGTVYVGSAADALHAFDAATGSAEWTLPTTSYVETAPTVVGDRVYTADADGVVYAVSTAGEEVWSHDTGRNLHSRTLAVHDGTVYVGTAGNMPAVVSGDTDRTKAGRVVALDAADGRERWSFEGPEEWFTGPAVGGGRVYVGNHDGTVLALDPATGEEQWTWTPTGSERAAHASVLVPPTYAGGTVYASVHAAGWVVALDAATGDLRWRRGLDAENVKSSPAVDDGRVYVGAARVRAVALGGGAADGGGADAGGADDATESAGTPTPEPGTYGKLYALDRADGATVWLHETDHDFRSSPAVVGDGVYVGGGDGALAVSRSDGEERWRVRFDDFVQSSPAVADGRAYVGSADGHLYCIGGG